MNTNPRRYSENSINFILTMRALSVSGSDYDMSYLDSLPQPQLKGKDTVKTSMFDIRKRRRSSDITSCEGFRGNALFRYKSTSGDGDGKATSTLVTQTIRATRLPVITASFWKVTLPKLINVGRDFTSNEDFLICQNQTTKKMQM